MAKDEIGVRRLRDQLSTVLRDVSRGKTVTITAHNQVVAYLVPARETRGVRESLLQVQGSGAFRWNGAKPKGLKRPVRGRGAPVSEAVLEERR